MRMSVLEVRWGLIPDMTGTQLLPRVVGLDVAKELTFTGRMVDGEEAVRVGLATRVSDTPLDDALALAREIAGKSPHAVRGAKALLITLFHRPGNLAVHKELLRGRAGLTLPIVVEDHGGAAGVGRSHGAGADDIARIGDLGCHVGCDGAAQAARALV